MAHQPSSSKPVSRAQPHQRAELVSDGAVEEFFWKGATGAQGQDQAYMLQASLPPPHLSSRCARMQFAMNLSISFSDPLLGIVQVNDVKEIGSAAG